MSGEGQLLLQYLKAGGEGGTRTLGTGVSRTTV